MKSNKRLIFELLIGLFLGGIIMFYTLKHTPTTVERKDDLLKKGFNKQEIDSIIKKEDRDMTYSILHLAG